MQSRSSVPISYRSRQRTGLTGRTSTVGSTYNPSSLSKLKALSGTGLSLDEDISLSDAADTASSETSLDKLLTGLSAYGNYGDADTTGTRSAAVQALLSGETPTVNSIEAEDAVTPLESYLTTGQTINTSGLPILEGEATDTGLPTGITSETPSIEAAATSVSTPSLGNIASNIGNLAATVAPSVAVSALSNEAISNALSSAPASTLSKLAATLGIPLATLQTMNTLLGTPLNYSQAIDALSGYSNEALQAYSDMTNNFTNPEFADIPQESEDISRENPALSREMAQMSETLDTLESEKGQTLTSQITGLIGQGVSNVASFIGDILGISGETSEEDPTDIFGDLSDILGDTFGLQDVSDILGSLRGSTSSDSDNSGGFDGLGEASGIAGGVDSASDPSSGTLA